MLVSCMILDLFLSCSQLLPCHAPWFGFSCIFPLLIVVSAGSLHSRLQSFIQAKQIYIVMIYSSQERPSPLRKIEAKFRHRLACGLPSLVNLLYVCTAPQDLCIRRLLHLQQSLIFPPFLQPIGTLLESYRELNERVFEEAVAEIRAARQVEQMMLQAMHCVRLIEVCRELWH